MNINYSPVKNGTAGESPLTGGRMMLSLAADGLAVSLSTDAGSLPIGGMAEAMTQTWLMCNQLFSDNTAVVLTTALAMATRNAAKALRWDRDIGSLVEGRSCRPGRRSLGRNRFRFVAPGHGEVGRYNHFIGLTARPSSYTDK